MSNYLRALPRVCEVLEDYFGYQLCVSAPTHEETATTRRRFHGICDVNGTSRGWYSVTRHGKTRFGIFIVYRIERDFVLDDFSFYYRGSIGGDVLRWARELLYVDPTLPHDYDY